MKRFISTVTVGIGIGLGFVNINITAAEEVSSISSRCIEKRLSEVYQVPEPKFFETLDGQKIPFALFDDLLSRRYPQMESEVVVQQSYSKIAGTIVQHTVRIFWTIKSTCVGKDPLAGLGDLAEVYDAEGSFMGFFVHFAGGRYISMPSPLYEGPSFTLKHL